MNIYDRRERQPNYRGKRPWVVDHFDSDGKRRSPGFATKKEADKFVTSGGTNKTRVEAVLVGAVFDAYLDDLDRRHGLGDRMAGYTRRRYAGIVNNHLRPALGKIRLKDLTVARCQTLIDKLALTSVHMYRDASLVLYMVMKLAVKRGWMGRSLFADEDITLAPRKRRTAPKFDRDDLRRLLAALEHPLPGERPKTHEIRTAVIMLAMFCALRRGEIAGLQLQSLDFVNKLIGIEHSHSTVDGLKDPKTVSGIRWVPMIPVVEAALRAVVNRAASEGRHKGYALVGRANSKSAYGSIYDYYFVPTMHAAGLTTEKSGKKSAGKGLRWGHGQSTGNGRWGVASGRESRRIGTPKFTFHDLRHAGISLMIESGMPILEVTKVAGHANANITLSIYAHLFNDKGTAMGAITGISQNMLPAPQQACNKNGQVIDLE
jgi:integrase